VSLDVKNQALYLAWYVYDEAGAPVWYVSLASWNQVHGSYEGDLLACTGPATEAAGRLHQYGRGPGCP
jgi:hypothetical protein